MSLGANVSSTLINLYIYVEIAPLTILVVTRVNLRRLLVGEEVNLNTSEGTGHGDDSDLGVLLDECSLRIALPLLNAESPKLQSLSHYSSGSSSQSVIKFLRLRQLLLSDFSSLPEAIEGINAPVVQTRYQGRMIPCSTLFVQRGFFDIFFPTDFEELCDMYEVLLADPGRLPGREDVKNRRHRARKGIASPLLHHHTLLVIHWTTFL